MQATSDYALAQRAASGDVDARDQLLARHYPTIERLCRRMSTDQASVDDVIQETCIAMLRSLGRYRGDASFSTWLYTLARTHHSRALRANRRHHVRVHRLHAHLSTIPQTDISDSFTCSTRWSQVNRALVELHPLDRTIFELREIQGYSAAEVSGITRLSISAVKTRLHRARKRIRTLLESLAQAQSHAA